MDEKYKFLYDGKIALNDITTHFLKVLQYADDRYNNYTCNLHAERGTGKTTAICVFEACRGIMYRSDKKVNVLFCFRTQKHANEFFGNFVKVIELLKLEHTKITIFKHLKQITVNGIRYSFSSLSQLDHIGIQFERIYVDVFDQQGIIVEALKMNNNMSKFICVYTQYSMLDQDDYIIKNILPFCTEYLELHSGKCLIVSDLTNP